MSNGSFSGQWFRQDTIQKSDSPPNVTITLNGDKADISVGGRHGRRFHLECQIRYEKKFLPHRYVRARQAESERGDHTKRRAGKRGRDEERTRERVSANSLHICRRDWLSDFSILTSGGVIPRK